MKHHPSKIFKGHSTPLNLIVWAFYVVHVVWVFLSLLKKMKHKIDPFGLIFWGGETNVLETPWPMALSSMLQSFSIWVLRYENCSSSNLPIFTWRWVAKHASVSFPSLAHFLSLCVIWKDLHGFPTTNIPTWHRAVMASNSLWRIPSPQRWNGVDSFRLMPEIISDMRQISHAIS